MKTRFFRKRKRRRVTPIGVFFLEKIVFDQVNNATMKVSTVATKPTMKIL